MFEILSERLESTFRNLRGQGRLTEDNISDSLREVRMALLEADVALPVVKEFILQVKERALGEEVKSSLSPGQMLIKIVHQQLVALMGDTNTGLNLQVQPPAIILVAGLQGAGKTTTVAKLARYLKESENRKVAVVSCDVYRPAAIDQLETLAKQVGVDFIPSQPDHEPLAIAGNAIDHARRGYFDVLIVDSAGRLHIDEKMMQEIKHLHEALHPVETLFIVDSMVGQDAVHAATTFNQVLPLTGVLLTKMDGDARGGAALSVRQVTGKPIKFMGTGEQTSALEPFYPERVASRILGMGDVLSLIEEVEKKTDKDKAQKLASRMKQGQRLTLEDFQEQLAQLRNMGGLGAVMDKLPGMPAIPKQVDMTTGNLEFSRLESIINSMTPLERRRPEIINGSRKRRIASGSGTRIQDVNRLLKQFTQMQKMMKRLSKKGGMQNFMRNLGGKMPPGGMPFS